MSLCSTELDIFTQKFDTTYEDKALSVRGQFLCSYPLNKLKNITLDEYVIGKGTASFCACVEAKTKAWANMQGATANKFGIYFGKTKSDPTMKYRFTQKFGKTKNEAFNGVKDALLDLIEAGRSKSFSEIDDNPLSQMFKAKILSLYFPELYLNICSSEHLKKIALDMKIPEQQFVSEYQHLLVERKMANTITKKWSNPKFMSFLYAKFIRGDLNTTPSAAVKKPRQQVRQRVNFEDIAANRDAIGKVSEEFAIEWERNRLIGLGYQELVAKIEDRRDIPSYGYDYLSFSAPGQERYIEVKSVGRDRKGNCYRFYLSENELSTSNSDENCNQYYFYLVLFGKDGKPCDLLARHAKEFYTSSEISPCAYVVRFDLEDRS
ncbi:DUF3883 domain-containing protein [Alishewanella jeotgali]|uniref:Putative hexulose 6 phosphate synthase n=1 Tax=Alishewanella jeotgali KCTC 22429 TaxID=1129374 RepID=H3Z9S9_9ALTE|nr:DUF3883 domain-containing protein [Alishewanella jeotgali]EHR42603.1 putative hexulose 6 phosphate synthase [Alishewanella jeotgali KCTC 22429]